MRDLDMQWGIILKWILIKQDGVEQIQLTEERVQWPALVNAVINIWVP
jgi:hypothetical protein